jgi:uncharacterized protein (DUF1501 family)
MACHCNEFSRAHLLRNAAAEAGRGLPAIEPGMPQPAGTGLNRRSFMLRAGLGMLSVYGASRLGIRELQEGIAKAQGTDQRVLLTVFMDGGTDSLSLLAPTEDARYQQFRPTLKLATGDTTPFSEDPALRWHPQAIALDQLHQAEKVSVIPAVGYDGADQSHFTSRHYWEVGELDPHARTGWLGRLIDQIGTDDNPLQGLSLDGWLSPSLATASRPVAAIDGSSYDLWAPGVWGEVEDLMFDAVQSVGQASAAGSDTGRAGAGRIADQSITLRSQLLPFGGEVTPPVPYPESDHWFPRNLAALAAMLDGGLPIRCVSTNAPGGYDTHDNQLGSFGDDIRLTFDTLAAFQADLESRGLADRVLTLVWSEFGRRPEQNGSGTDHGAAGAAFVIGTKAQGEMVGEFRGLDDLDEDDNLRHSTDFRAVYGSLLGQWFDVDPGSVIPDAASFELPQLVKDPAP